MEYIQNENIKDLDNIKDLQDINKKTAGVSVDNFAECKLQFYEPAPIVNPRLANAYVPFQCLVCLYPPDLGLNQGTIFPELDRPYGVDPEFTIDQ